MVWSGAECSRKLCWTNDCVWTRSWFAHRPSRNIRSNCLRTEIQGEFQLQYSGMQSRSGSWLQCFPSSHVIEECLPCLRLNILSTADCWILNSMNCWELLGCIYTNASMHTGAYWWCSRIHDTYHCIKVVIWRFTSIIST